MQLTAPCVIDGPINGLTFQAYVEQFLVPTLGARRRCHHGQSRLPQGPARARAIERAGATLLYLPPYSPDLNPIEQVFAKLKAMLRKAATRSLDACGRRRRPLTRFQPGECANYFQNSGYGPPNRNPL